MTLELLRTVTETGADKLVKFAVVPLALTLLGLEPDGLPIIEYT